MKRAGGGEPGSHELTGPVRLARWLLATYPAAFREAHRDEVLEFIEVERSHPLYAGGSMAGLRFWARTLWDLAKGSARLRLRPLRRSDHRPSMHRPTSGGEMLGSTLQDFRYAVRSLRSSPATTVVVVLTLALGVGMNTAIFSVVNTVLLRPFEYENPDELMFVNARLETDEIDALISGGSYREIREQVSAFEDVAAVATIRQNLTGVDLAEQVDVGWVSTNLFSLLGVPAWTGRIFREDDPAGTAMLSYATWRGALGADPDVSGRTIQLDGRIYTIVGVLPPGFEMHLPRTPSEVDVWKVPDDWWQNGDLWGSQGPAFAMFRLIGRRRDDVSVDQVRTELGAIADDLRGRFQEYETSGLALQAVPLQESVVRQIRPTILLLFGAVGFVLLIACANVMNLLLVRAQARKREVALRVALGSSRGRIVRMFLVESLLLAALGGTAGVMLGVLGIDLLEALRPPGVPRIDSVSADATVFGFALGISLLCTVLFGLLPALGAARRSVTSDMRQSGASHGRSRQRLNRGLAVAQISMSLVLLIGAGLLTASLSRLQDVRPGFEYENILTFSISLPGARYEWPLGVDRFYLELEERIEGLPGVESAGVVWPMPLTDTPWSGQYLAGAVEEQDRAYAGYRLVTPDYFETVRTALVDGRGFGNGDPKRTVVVSRNLAERAWPGQTAIGKQLAANPWGGGNQPFEIIGVVENVHYSNLSEPPDEAIYFDSKGWAWTDWEVLLAVRTETDPSALIAPIRDLIRSMDSEIPMADARPWKDYVRDHLATNRFALMLIGLFALVAAALAAIGLYGVLSYSVSQRTKEMGIRIALGSERNDILRLVLRQGMALAATGVVLGVLGAVGLTRFLSTFLYGVTATDPQTFIVIAGGLSIVAAVACYLPARRATRLDPMSVLRTE